jgi:voltage-gated potassium channel
MQIITNLHVFTKEIVQMITSPVFILLTVVGNSFIGISSYVFFMLEKDNNPKMHHFIDALWWGFATATTTGYGDITPVTMEGKILGMFMMLTGLAFFAVFTALFADTFLTSKLHKYNKITKPD